MSAAVEGGHAAAVEQVTRELLWRTGVLLDGHFLLTSGRHSPRFLLFSQLFQDPGAAEQVGRLLAGRLLRHQPTVVVGPAMGGVILAHEAARALGARSLFAEKEPDGSMALKRGFTLRAGDRVAVVEDAVTTGGSVQKVIDHLAARGADLVAIGCVADRSGGRAAGRWEPLPLVSLIRLDIPSYAPEECPQCRDGVPLASPKGR